jgi:Domain of unknown function (DUF4136)
MNAINEPAGAIKDTVRRLLGASALALSLVLTACATAPPKIQTEHDGTMNFAAYRTFAILRPRASGSAVDPGTAIRLTEPAMDAVREAMTAKGMTEAAVEKADCAVRVSGQSMEKVEVTDWGYTSYPYGARRAGWVYGPGAYGGSNVDVRQVTERKLIVEIYDNASRKEAWVGWSEHSGDAKVEPEQLKQAIRNILASFPPAPGTK